MADSTATPETLLANVEQTALRYSHSRQDEDRSALLDLMVEATVAGERWQAELDAATAAEDQELAALLQEGATAGQSAESTLAQAAELFTRSRRRYFAQGFAYGTDRESDWRTDLWLENLGGAEGGEDADERRPEAAAVATG
jgi:hypothetical protein